MDDKKFYGMALQLEWRYDRLVHQKNNNMKGMVLSMKLRVVMTNGINYLIESGEFKDKDLMSALLKFHSDDWGILCNEDKEFQNELLKNPNSKYEDRFMGVYMINKHKIWIMSEYDYSIKSLLITILLSEEY